MRIFVDTVPPLAGAVGFSADRDTKRKPIAARSPARRCFQQINVQEL